MTENIYLVMLLLFSAGIILPILTSGSPKITNILAHGLAVLGCLAIVACSVEVFMTGGVTFTYAMGLPVGSLIIRIDNLSAFFLLALGVVGTAASIYALGYSREYYKQRLGLMAALYNCFILSMALVLTVSQVAYFLIAWELMTVVSFFLVNHEYEKTANTRAAYKYILMTTLGTVFITTAFLILTMTVHSLDFQMFKGASLTSTMRNIVFFCALLGFGTKAGVIPLHIWLPEAHPAAPSHVSALMSGIMIKTAIYGMCRFFLEFLGVGPAWWGEVVLFLAIISSVLGVLYALMQNDLKRLLAYSSVENIGIILLGIGAGMVFMSNNQPVLAGLAFAAGLFHLFNHAVFKSLLFLGAGSVLYSTHTKNIEDLGGLIKKMPYTAVFFLTGAAAISALPTLNGFVSEWLTYQSLFYLPQAVTGILPRLGSVLLIALLGLTGALAANCFVKAFGVTFLAKPRSKHAEQAKEVPATMLTGMGLLSLMCFALGVWPQGMLKLLQGVLSQFAGLEVSTLFNHQWYAAAFNIPQANGVIAMPVVVGMLVLGLIAAVLVYNFNGKPKNVEGETWTCGIIPNARMEYTATGFAQPVRRAYKAFLRTKDTVTADKSLNPYHGVKMKMTVGISYLIDVWLYRPVKKGILFLVNRVKPLQSGNLQHYIGYVLLVTVVILILGVRW
ncbi:hydrogenase 4 subunit B [Desulfosporosinus hippei]|uniref:Hydrogenase-4 component B n=1 Tax=Desulfosporosinus hippei DSM 8344 TaxID=1121419 RepID=A0A1G8E502_9FIRM|nr:hydrogenase 4 subunit B [Desulfosporosinus hippei]SDH65003.1 hydrogenase-4 component B [Desulfosporosinus hippei DSM 8344]